MAEEKKVVTLDDFEQRLMVSGLMVIDAPTKKEKRRADREAR